MLVALLEVAFFSLGLTVALAVVPYALWVELATSHEQMLRLMVAMPFVVWATATVYWRGYEAARVGMVRLGYYASIPSFARAGLPRWSRRVSPRLHVQRAMALTAACLVALFP